MDIYKVAKRLREILDDVVSGKVDKALLFGSRIRGDGAADADLDILIIIRGDCPWQLQNSVLDACYTLALEFDIVTDIKVYGSNDLAGARGRQSFILNALKYGIAA